MKRITDLRKCTGCGLCKSICPKDCITMRYSDEGFLQPYINKKKCINCKLCQKYCIVEEFSLKPKEFFKTESNILEKKYFKVQTKDKKMLLRSSSGGIFGELAKYVIKYMDGVVYGAIQMPDLSVKHIGATTMKELDLMRFSKYNQSDITEIYSQIKNYIKNGKVVLFTGTPCQVYALKKYLNYNGDRLITLDLICFGVMSTKFLQDYVKYILKKHCLNGEGIKINFRSKEIKENTSYIVYKNDEKIIFSEKLHGSKSGLGYGFASGMLKRRGCETCFFQTEKRFSDITIGDFVDGKNGIADFNSSLVVVNNMKIYEILKKLDIYMTELDEKDLLMSLNRLKHKPKFNIRRNKLFSNYLKNGIDDKLFNMLVDTELSLFEKIKIKIKEFWLNI